jgi:hypothetical protein
MLLPLDLADVLLPFTLLLVGQSFGSILGQFASASERDRQAEGQKAESQAALEQKVLLELAQSTDTDIATMALTGLLGPQTSTKKGKGLRGFITEVEQNPVLPLLQQLVGSQKLVQREVQPSQAVSAPISGTAIPPELSPNRPGAAAQPPRGTVEQVPGMSPSVNLQPIPPTPTPRMETIVESQPRQVFRTPEDVAREQASGRIGGILESIGGSGLSAEDQRRATLGALGAPEPSGVNALNVLYADGTTGAVTLAPDGTWTDQRTGQPAGPIAQIIPNNAFSGGGQDDYEFAGNFFDPETNQLMRREIRDSDGSVRLLPIAPPTPPAAESGAGTATLPDGTVVTLQRDRAGNISVVGAAGGQREPQSVSDAIGFTRELRTFKLENEIGPLNPQQDLVNAEVRRLTNGLYQTEAELESAAQRGIQRPRNFESILPGGGVLNERQARPGETSSSVTADSILQEVQRNRDKLPQ